jgi:hypothetical protein
VDDVLPAEEVLLVRAPPPAPEPLSPSPAAVALPLVGAGSGVALAVAARSPAFAAAAGLTALAAVLTPLLVAGRRGGERERDGPRRAPRISATSTSSRDEPRRPARPSGPRSTDATRRRPRSSAPCARRVDHPTGARTWLRTSPWSGSVPDPCESHVRLALADAAGLYVEVDGDLALAARDAVDRTATVAAAVVALDLLDARHVAVVGPPDLAMAMVGSWHLQLLVASHVSGLDVSSTVTSPWS